MYLVMVENSTCLVTKEVNQLLIILAAVQNNKSA